MFLACHVYQIMFTEKLFPEWVADKMEGVRADIGENFVGELGVLDEDDVFSDDVVGGEASVGGFR